jgi:hypothetical protein
MTRAPEDRLVVRIEAPAMARLRAYHLAPGKSAEALSYVWARAVTTAGGTVVLIPRNAPTFLFAPDCFVRQSAGNVQLAPDVLNGLLVRFAASGFNTLVNVHDHWFDDYTSFSGVDDRDDASFDLYLRRSFEPMLARHPHIGPSRPLFNLSVVLGQKGAAARLVDVRREAPFQPVTALTIVGERLEQVPLGHRRDVPVPSDVFARQSDFISAAHQAQLAGSTVALVGCGGLGSILAESLARVGVGGLVLVDDDAIDRTNLNRWQGATPRSVGQPKAYALASRLRRMLPSLRVWAIRRSLHDPAVEAALATADLVVGALDNDEARYVLNRVSVQYCLPYLDAGVAVTGTAGALDFRTRIFCVLPGTTACAQCTQFQLFARMGTPEVFLHEAAAASRRAAGYVVEAPAAATPSVYALNQRAASLLVTEFLNLVCGWRPAATTVTESWREGKFERADRVNFPEPPDPECAICGFFAGAGDSEPLPRPRTEASKEASRRDA